MADFYDSKFTGAEIDSRLESVPNKTDRVQNATAGNIATLKEDGGIEDSGKKLSDFANVEDLQKKADLGEDGKVPAGQVDAYSKSESISAETRTALSLPETATPDAALAEIARQLSESSGVQIDLLYENASPSSQFPAQKLIFDMTSYAFVIVEHRPYYGTSAVVAADIISRSTRSITRVGWNGSVTQYLIRHFDIKDDGIDISQSNIGQIGSNEYIVPIRMWGIKTV